MKLKSLAGLLLLCCCFGLSSATLASGQQESIVLRALDELRCEMLVAGDEGNQGEQSETEEEEEPDCE